MLYSYPITRWISHEYIMKAIEVFLFLKYSWTFPQRMFWTSFKVFISIFDKIRSLPPPLTCTENNVLHCQPNAYLLHYPHTVFESLPHHCIFLNLISAPLPISKYHLMHCCIFPPCLTWVQQRKMYSPWAPQPFFLFPSSSLYKSICH